jgi:HlyD family secretion protein
VELLMPTDLLDATPPAPLAKTPAPADGAGPGSVAPAAPAAAIETLLGEPDRPPWRRMLRAAAVAALLAVTAVGGFALYRHLQAKPAQYATTPVRRGDLAVTVTVTGNLAPVNQVDVGSELSGTIDHLYVDENDHVRKGQVLASLDTSRLRDQITLGEAAILSARASLQQMAATVHETGLAAGRLHKLYDVSNGGWPAKADIDAADAAQARAQAAEAAARAAIAQAEATLNTNRTNLSKATIRSPVDGVVLSRKVDVGQTVAATLQAPVLFTIAQDMRRMELDADVDEADVGQVKEGQGAVFTVDAYPGREYAATVTRVGFGSQTKEGVVTYKGVLSVDNSDLSLRPGMTASADIRTTTRTNVLLAPDAALRFSPPAAAQAPAAGSALVPRMPRMGVAPTRRSADPHRQQVWVLKDGRPTMLPVRVGASDGRETEISGPGVQAGLPVIIEALGGGK